ncbi:MAG: FAD-dependent oxidoreductase [Planctomycetes bacterium]|nr:FAD-dependent oxidoreductase [Planctomycetota bacterium]
MTAPHAIVLGGGVAGITAAFLLRDRGATVTLCEAHRGLGGRAFTLPRRHAGDLEADNGPHVMLGCYRRFRWLLRRLGTEQLFGRPATLRLGFLDAHGRRDRLRLWPGPAPLAMPWAVLGLRALTLRERVRLLRGLAAVLLGARRGEDLGAWLARRDQHGAPRAFLWEPMCRAIMNAEPEAVDAATFVATLRRAFLGSGRAAALWAPSAPWSEIIGEPAARALTAAGVDVLTGHRAIAIERAAGRATAVHFADGTIAPVGHDDVVVCALPWHALARIDPTLAPSVDALPGAPIVSVYFDLGPLSFHGGVLPPDPIVALIGGGPFDFLCRWPGDGSGRVALLSGGGRDLDGLAAEQIVAAARRQLARHLPDLEAVHDAPARLCKEARATIVCAPGGAPLRPSPGPVPGCANLRLCGDWTATGLPSTLEGAAESAHRALAAW